MSSEYLCMWPRLSPLASTASSGRYLIISSAGGLRVKNQTSSETTRATKTTPPTTTRVIAVLLVSFFLARRLRGTLALGSRGGASPDASGFFCGASSSSELRLALRARRAGASPVSRSGAGKIALHSGHSTSVPGSGSVGNRSLARQSGQRSSTDIGIRLRMRRTWFYLSDPNGADRGRARGKSARVLTPHPRAVRVEARQPATP